MKKKIDVAIAFFNFLKAARNRVKEGMSKEQILAFAKQEFGEVTKLLRKQIDDLFKAKPKTQKKGDVIDVSFKPGKDKKGRVVEESPSQKQEGLVRRPEEFATRKQYEKYLDETLGPSDDVFGSPIKEDLLKEWDKVKAKNVTPKKEGILATDEAAKIVKKRTKDIAKGDPTGEISEIMEGLGSLKNIKQGGKGLDPREGVVRAAAREILNKNKINIGKEDPIDLLRKTYGEAGLDAVDAIGDDLLNTQTYGEMNDLLAKNKLFNLKAKKVPGYDKSIQDAEELRMLDEFDPKDRDPNAYGGIAGNLRLNRTGYFAGRLVKGYKAGQGAFTKAQVLIQRLENTIKAYIGKKDKLSKYVQETFPNFIKEIKANPKLADDENVWKTLGQDLPSDQELVVYGDDTVDFFRQTEGPGNIERVKKFLGKNPFLNREEALKIMKMKPTDQVMEVERLKTIRTKKHALGGRVQMADGGLINILKL
jgi:hypothetical protein